MIKKPYFIAEIGSNWCRTDDMKQNLAIAKSQMYWASCSGADAVKFQLFTAKDLYGQNVSKEIEQRTSKYSLPVDWIPELAKYAEELYVDFLCSVFNPDKVEIVDPYVKMHKVAAPEVEYHELIETMIDTKKPVMISFRNWYQDNIRDHYKDAKLIYMLCSPKYPSEPKDYNLHELINITRAVKPYALGVSDHTFSPIVAITSLAFGTMVFEKHFDGLMYDKSCEHIKTPDSSHSVSRKTLKDYVDLVNIAYQYSKSMETSYDVKRKYGPYDDFELKVKRRLIDNEFARPMPWT